MFCNETVILDNLQKKKQQQQKASNWQVQFNEIDKNGQGYEQNQS